MRHPKVLDLYHPNAVKDIIQQSDDEYLYLPANQGNIGIIVKAEGPQCVGKSFSLFTREVDKVSSC